MEIIKKNKEKKEMVRIIIGATETGSKSIKAPTKTITLIDITVQEVYDKISKFLLDLEKR